MQMFKRRAFLTIVLVFICSICSCWDAKDVDRLAFPIAASYDVHEGNPEGLNILNQGPMEEPTVDVTILNPNLTPDTQSSVTVETLPAATTTLSRDKRSFTVSEIYVTGFNKVLLMGEQLARQGFNPVIESTYRFPSISHTVRVAIAEGRGDEMLKTPVQNYENMGVYLLNMLNDYKGNSFIPTVTFHQLEVWQSPGKNPILPLLIRGGSNEVIIGGLAIFKKDRMIGKIDTQQSRVLMLLRGIPSQGYIPYALTSEGSQGAVFVYNDRKVQVERQEDNYAFTIKIKLKGTIQEHPIEHMIDVDHSKEIEESVARAVQKECLEFLQTMQEDWKVDCIDISKYALAKWRRELTDVVDQEEFISAADIRVEVEVVLVNSGEKR